MSLTCGAAAVLGSYGDTDRAGRGEGAVEGRCTVHHDVFLTCTCVRLYSYGWYHFDRTDGRGVRCLVDTTVMKASLVTGAMAR